MDVTFGVLGPVEVWGPDREPVLMAPQARRLLALLIAADGVASTHLVAEAIVGAAVGSAPRMAVSRLRRSVGDRLATVHGGYRLKVGPGELDVDRMMDLRTRARLATSEDRADLLAQALALWRGSAYDGYAHEPWAEAVAHGLDEARANTAEELAEALIELGRASEAIELLERHVIVHPFRERPVDQLMRALAMSGRFIDASNAFLRFRSGLLDAGLDPTPRLGRLARDILVGASSSPLPPGLVTFVGVGIAAATKTMVEAGEGWPVLLSYHRAIVRSVMAENGGRLLRFVEDAALIVFTDGTAALAAALAVQQAVAQQAWPSDAHPGVRVGVHTGWAAPLETGDYSCVTTRRLTRITELAHAGEVLVSAAALDMWPRPSDDIVAVDLGTRPLRDMAEDAHLYRLVARLRATHAS